MVPRGSFSGGTKRQNLNFCGGQVTEARFQQALMFLHFLAKVSHEMENIADCEITESKNAGRTAFRIWYFSNNSHEFKHHDFEADNTVTGIYINLIAKSLPCRHSPPQRLLGRF
jgi:hypothetical protein